MALTDTKARTERTLDLWRDQAARQANGALLRVLNRTRVDDQGCILWCGNRDGEVEVLGRRWQIHRLVYLFLVGPLPDGWCQIQHRCGNRYCVNPRHLVLVRRE